MEEQPGMDITITLSKNALAQIAAAMFVTQIATTLVLAGMTVAVKRKLKKDKK